MSAPAPFTVKTPALYVAEPASAGDPMSASVQGTGSGGGGATTVRLTVVAWVAEGAVPVATLEATARPRVALPPAVTLVGVSVAVTPAGRPLTERATVSALPEMTAVVMPVPPEAPWAIERLAGLAAMEKSLGVAVESATVSK